LLIVKDDHILMLLSFIKQNKSTLSPMEKSTVLVFVCLWWGYEDFQQKRGTSFDKSERRNWHREQHNYDWWCLSHNRTHIRLYTSDGV
jgi:hypothetical protein